MHSFHVLIMESWNVPWYCHHQKTMYFIISCNTVFLLQGAQWLQDESPLCRVTCSDGSTHTIRACVNSSLIEVNQSLIDKPHLLQEKVWGKIANNFKWFKIHCSVIVTFTLLFSDISAITFIFSPILLVT